MASHAPSTGAPSRAPVSQPQSETFPRQRPTFDPEAWLASFRNVGGGYAATDAGVHLLVVTTGQPAASSRMARSMLNNLSDWDLHLVNEQVLANLSKLGRA